MRDSLITAVMICLVLAGCSGNTPTSSSGVGNGSIVEVTDFRADSICGIQIHWTTIRETNNIGFNVYRSLDSAGQYEKINPDTVPARKRPCIYRFADDSVPLYDPTYWYKLENVSLGGDTAWYGPISATLLQPPVSVFWLGGSTPNPYYIEAGGHITLRYVIAGQQYITLTIYDTTGNQIRSLIDEIKMSGYHSVIWDTKNDSGAQGPENFYDYTLTGFHLGQPVEVTKRLEIVNTIP